MMRETRLSGAAILWRALLVLVLGAGGQAMAGEVCIEAEDLTVVAGWRVVSGYEGYMTGEPEWWSANRLRADAGDDPAEARTTFQAPAAGTYNLWVRFESAYGFESLFSVEVRQAGKPVASGDFGGKEERKYFTMGRGWQVQGPWHYHNADWVYQKLPVTLATGPAELVLKKGRNGRPAGLRVVDLFYLTTDLDLEPVERFPWGRTPETAPRILSQFKTSIYVKARVSREAAQPAVVEVEPRFWLTGYYQGPRDVYYFTPAGLTTKRPTEKDALPPGAETGWCEIRVEKVYPLTLLARSSGVAEIMVCKDPANAAATLLTVPLPAMGPKPARKLWYGEMIGPEVRQIIVSTGNGVYERGVLNGRFARVFDDYLDEMTRGLEAMQVPGGRKPTRFHFAGSYPVLVNRFDMRRLMSALGINSQYMQSDPAVYGPEGKAMGFLQDRGFISLQNQHMGLQPRAIGRNCYEGDYTRLRDFYQKRFEDLKKDGLGAMPQTIKLIEEAGAPRLAYLKDWEKIQEAFRSYARERGLKPAALLRPEDQAELAKNGQLPGDEELWPKVRIYSAPPEEADRAPVLFYHSQVFRTRLLARNCAAATKLIEEIFSPGSRTHSGSFLPSTGSMAALAHGTDPFLLFKERGVTGYSSEISWGLNLPDYVGPQIQSYEGALSRALAKYHNVPRGSYLIADRNRGYPADFVEITAYTFAVNGFDRWNYFSVGYPEGCSVLGCPEILEVIRRANYTIGAVEDRLADAKVVPARVAIGWSQTSDVWDTARPTPEPEWLRPGNTIYAGERTYLYLLLRHLQTPVDILSEADLTDGYLDKYSTYVLVGDHLSPEAAEALKQWVRNGGNLISVAGGGLLDPYNRPLDTLKEVFGIQSAKLEKKAESLRPKLEMIHTPPIDEIAFTSLSGATTVPVTGYRQTFTTTGGRVVGKYRNGETGAVLNDFGKGKALIIGALPGHSYLIGAFPMLPFGRGGEDLSSVLFPDYNATVRETIGAAIRELVPPPPIRTSVPVVEAWLLTDSRTGAHSVGLVNFSGRAVENLQVRIAAAFAGGAKSATGAFGKVVSRVDGGDLVVDLRIDRMEVLSLR